MRRTAVSAPAPAPRWRLLLAGALLIAIVALALAWSWSQWSAAKERHDREAAARQAAAAQHARLQENVQAARAALEQSPGDPIAHIQLARACALAGQNEEAAQQATLAASLAPQDTQVLSYAADVDVHIQRPDLAVDTYKHLLAVDPQNAQALTHLADLYLAFDWPLEAEALLKAAVRTLPDNLDLKIALAAVYAQHGDFAEAEPLLVEIRRHSPAESTLWSNMAHVYLLSRRYADAVAVAQQAAAQWHDPVGWLYLGQAYYAQGDYDHAIRAYQQMLAQQPDALDPHYYLGLCYQQQNRLEEAIQEWETVLRRNPDFQQTRLLLGQLYVRTGRAAEGERLLADFRRAQPQREKLTTAYYLVSINPHSAKAHWRMAQVYRDEGNTPLLLVELRKTLELAPHHAEARHLLDQTLPHSSTVMGP